MTAQIIDGIHVAKYIKSKMTKKIAALRSQNLEPCLATILVGDNVASATYIKNKQRAAVELGLKTKDVRLPSSCSQSELIAIIKSLNEDIRVHGILVQLPLPNHLDPFIITNTINPIKDVDGLTPTNMGLLIGGKGSLKPCTPVGIVELLDHYGINVSGLHVVIINRSQLVGKPLAFLLLEKDATVTICHSKSYNLLKEIKDADLIVTAIGNRDKFTLTGSMIKTGSIIIDVGITRLGGKLAGDVDYSSVAKYASWITPVPGGVGPMTVSMLLNNTLIATSLSKN
ncbi:MAG TPA: bifunctional 5,10-methylenetetrahydrofolate dehydrogenase/5,10-methenyltetrahydrofolate cyclohydrolase [Nitrososphaeraceae archaeon]